jgi:hypothetical protein
VLAAKRARYTRVSSALASYSDVEIAGLLGADGSDDAGGGPAVIDVDGVAVFAKRVPLTDRELAHPLSTANLFALPTFCQYFFGMPRFPRYGFGGPALSAWRELAANRILTDAVLDGQAASFPLLYHWRVLAVRPPITAEPADVDAVVDALDGSPAVRDRLEALREASHSLVLFCEYVPYPVAGWLEDDPSGKAEAFERQLLEIVHFLRGQELLHMDGNFDNMRTDGTTLHFVDFGLATSPRFDLSPAERDFADRNASYDINYASMRLVHWMATSVCGVTIPSTGDLTARSQFVRRCADGHLPEGLPPAVAGILTRHAAIADSTNNFYRRLFDGDLYALYPAEQAPLK